MSLYFLAISVANLEMQEFQVAPWVLIPGVESLEAIFSLHYKVPVVVQRCKYFLIPVAEPKLCELFEFRETSEQAAH